MKLAALCGLFVCAMHVSICVIFVLFYFWRELFIFYFGLEFWPNYTGPIIWCPTCVKETRIYSFILFWIFSFGFTSFHISLIGFGMRKKRFLEPFCVMCMNSLIAIIKFMISFHISALLSFILFISFLIEPLNEFCCWWNLCMNLMKDSVMVHSNTITCHMFHNYIRHPCLESR